MNVPLVTTAVAVLLSTGCSGRGREQATEKKTPVAENVEAPSLPASNRPDVIGTTSAVVSDHPLASAAGAEVLRRGGNAVDAAVTMAAVLAVVRPHMNGIGGDAFALFYDAKTAKITALNGSGRAGALATPALFQQRGLQAMPDAGALTITVPGAVAAWEDALRRHGTITLAQALEPAIHYASDGFPVSTKLRDDIAEVAPKLNAAGRALYLPHGSPPAFGTILKSPALAETLREIAKGGARVFYSGPIAERLAAFITAAGGYLRADDFARHQSTWQEPLRAEYLGYEVVVLPPNSQALALLQQMQMARAFDLEAIGHNSARYLHTLIELKRLAFADRDRWIADPTFTEVPVARLLDPEYLRGRAALVSPAATAAVRPGFGADSDRGAIDARGDTVYVMAVDRWGNAASWVQSVFDSFGSGLVEPSTGIVLHNRGAGFTLDPAHPNVIAPGKRPFHTLTAAMVLQAGKLRMTLGTPGADGQTQTLLQVFNNVALFQMTPQQAVEAPRFRSNAGRNVAIEASVAESVRGELSALGYELRVVNGWSSMFGGAQMIYVHPDSGVRITAADPRREAYAIAE